MTRALTRAVTRAVRVDDPGPLTTVQDTGRPGWAHLGVPRAGALDAPAAALANRLVGNPAGAALLETTAGGVALTTTAAMTLAVTGAACSVRVDGRERAFGAALTVPAGAAVRLGPALTGVRSYLALAGGVAVPAVLGSRSTDTLAGVGPPPLRAGDLLPVGAAHGEPADLEAPPAPRRAGAVVLRLLPGPRVERFPAGTVDRLAAAPYSVGPLSNRVALRLEGPPLARDTAEVPPEGLVLGAVQVPASGQPLVFLADHPTTGGYPVLGVVHPGDLPACGQLRPGQEVRFVAG